MAGTIEITQVSVQSPSNDLQAGQVVTISIGADQALTVSAGTPTVTLSNGGVATYTGTSSSGQLQFSYIVGSNADTEDLRVTSLSQNGATIVGAAGIAFDDPITLSATPLTHDAITTADLNGDGRQDVIVADRTTNSVEIFMNSGNGLAAPVSYAAGAFPTAVTAADLNGDGRADLVLANTDSNTISVLMNNGNGTFASPITVSVAPLPTSVVVADVNGDGRPDIVVGGGTFQAPVSVLLNAGAGMFSTSAQYQTDVGNAVVVTADINGDGLPDLIMAGLYGEAMFINNGNSFDAPQIYASSGIDVAAVADVNGDGSPDLIIGSGSGNAASVSLNDGGGHFSAAILQGYNAVTTTGGLTAAMIAARLATSGALDLVTTNTVSNKLSILPDENGTFSIPVIYDIGENNANIAAADINGDGQQDILLAGANGLTLMINAANAPGLMFDTAGIAALPGADTGLQIGGVHSTGSSVAGIGDATNQAYVQRLYVGLFGHSGDLVGLNGWLTALNSGVGQQDIAVNFLASPEYANIHGAQTNSSFMQTLYTGLLGRDPSASELGYWTGVLEQSNAGTLQARAAVVNSIASSAEARSVLSADTASPGTNSADYALIAKLYETGLGRAIEQTGPGLNYWAGDLQIGSTLSQLAVGIASSAEFQQAHIGQTDDAYIASLFQNGLGRTPDTGALQTDLNALQSGAISRAGLLLAISQSPEAQTHLQASL